MSMAHRITEVVVVIPAHNEEGLVVGCLRSLMAAIVQTRSLLSSAAPRLRVILVADGCTDRTVDYALAFPEVTVLEQPSRGVGSARRAGINYALRSTLAATRSVWIINTDADTRVAENWISEHLRVAGRGVDLLIGAVRPDFDDLSVQQVAAWLHSHPGGRPSGHTHGANLGIRGNVYRAIGGFADLDEHEDVDLVDRARKRGARIVATDTVEVVTSGRQTGRTPGGYARYLREELEIIVANN